MSNPEFLKEGDAVRDCLRPDRIVIGGHEGSAGIARLVELYLPFVRTPEQILIVSRVSAELIKYANNAMLATRISFMNELARLCEATGADIDDIRRGIGSDERIGSAFLYAGASWGGSCFGKDLRSLIAQAEDHCEHLGVVEAALNANGWQRDWFYRRILETVPQGGTVALWGLSFKPGTDDVRDAPAIDFATWLANAQKNISVQVYDPQAMETARVALDGVAGIEFCDGPYKAASGADALVLCTEWPQLRYPDWSLLNERMAQPGYVFDGRNVWSQADAERHGFVYQGVGRGEG